MKVFIVVNWEVLRVALGEVCAQISDLEIVGMTPAQDDLIELIETAKPDVVIREFCKRTAVVEEFRDQISPTIFLIGIGDPSLLHEHIEDYSHIFDGFISMNSSLEHIQQEIEEVQRQKFSPEKFKTRVSTMLKMQG